MIKYVKSVLWRVAKRLSYKEEVRCLKVKARPRVDHTPLNTWLSLANTFQKLLDLLQATRTGLLLELIIKKYILKDPSISNGTFVKCPEKAETIQLIAGACLALSPNDYTIVVIR